jgi:hypothetical protein
LAEILEYVAIELLGVANTYLSRHPKMAYYVLPEKPFSPAAAMLTRGFASIQFEKYSTTTTEYL